jgi:catechol 2,3-dioxygenase-like lactoylglutathione lyase family enzyme
LPFKNSSTYALIFTAYLFLSRQIIYIVHIGWNDICRQCTNANTMTSNQPAGQIRSVAFRYIVNDVDAAVNFYVNMLGFHADQHVKSAFASLSVGNSHLFINRPGAGGAGQAMPDGTVPAPGGWNRILITVDDLEHTVKELKSKGATFRNEIVVGVGGNQILLQDPSGNLVELFQPAQSR